MDIVRDTMQQLEAGYTLAEARDYVDSTYGGFGQPTHTDPVP